ncbi:hypothetical protein A9267_09995 [Shewanella sp. UCD-FRSSP16_17]|uniref:hypothetical protein n=1 Tax=Shewanella sp. UCD-FRSSP16_17 TaxID=1853256 RepID=UPI0007EEA1F8|nr:hypothetical protein [Shewanella sp. UCD-FRSSP16_17]OBT08048.1 hypothetical protein A9267_09995 [Shewanella sp. UCD-FRSSP16_17]
MSMPTKNISCTGCQFTVNSMVTWGAHFYLTNDDEIYFKSQTGWCYKCCTISSIELVESRCKIEHDIIKLSKQVLPNFKHVLQWLASSSYRETLQGLRDLHLRLDIVKSRAGKEVCLTCGSDHVQAYTPNQVSELLNNKSVLLPHPNCKQNGYLTAEDGVRLKVKIPSKYYDFNGQRIEKD